MKSCLAAVVLFIALSAGMAVPASADVFDNRLGNISAGHYGERSERRAASSEDGAARYQRKRIARATMSDADDDDYVPRRAERRDRDSGDRDVRSSRSKPAHAARHHGKRKLAKRTAKRSVAARAERRATRQASGPTWTRRNLASSGPRGSGQGGIASFYWQPQRLASGGWFNPNAMTAAHKTLPFGTRVRVTHKGNGRSVIVRINDRGPYIAGRVIDLSKAAAGVIGMTAQGVARVAVEILGR